MMDMDPKLFVAAFPHEDGRVLYVMKGTWHCRNCGRHVKLVVEIDGAPPVCVACDEMSRLINPAAPKGDTTHG